MLRSLTFRRWHILVLACLTLAVILPGLSNLPVIDRDEARFAQASIQMAETNDLLNIQFQNEARNKKPAAAYWAQTAMLKIFSNDGEQRLWVHRLPSVLASLLSILALYWGGSRMVGRDSAFVASALFAVSAIFVFEGHIAKTDALLCASTTVALACLGRLRRGNLETGRIEVWGFWIALGISIMIKGPIAPVLVILSLASLWVWERHLSWAKPLLNIGAILTFILIWVPWGLAMFVVTDGAFFTESIGNDLGRKISTEQEGHGGMPGFHTLSIWLTLWPASLFLLPGLVYAAKSAKSERRTQIAKSLRLLLCWVLPFWILIELMPTKLPHYGLPVFPAICLMIGVALTAMKHRVSFKKTRIFGGITFLVSCCVLLGALLYIQTQYGEPDLNIGTYMICGLSGLVALLAVAALWGRKIDLALGSGVLAAVIFLTGSYGYALPNMENFKTSERLHAELQRFSPETVSKNIHSPHYTEPSLVYHMGRDIDVSGSPIDLSDGSLVILNIRRDTAEKQGLLLRKAARKRGLCIESSDRIDGFNYSRGTPLSLVILREGPC